MTVKTERERTTTTATTRDVNRGSKNRNSLQIRVFKLETLYLFLYFCASRYTSSWRPGISFLCKWPDAASRPSMLSRAWHRRKGKVSTWNISGTCFSNSSSLLLLLIVFSVSFVQSTYFQESLQATAGYPNVSLRTFGTDNEIFIGWNAQRSCHQTSNVKTPKC